MSDLYDRGYVDGVRAFAWWKDGEQYVGTTGMKMTDAIVQRRSSPGYDPPVDRGPDDNARLVYSTKKYNVYVVQTLDADDELEVVIYKKNEKGEEIVPRGYYMGRNMMRSDYA